MQLLPPDPLPEAYIRRVEFFDEDGQGPCEPQTGRALRVRIHFSCERQRGRYSLYLSIWTLEGTRLIGYSMESVAGFQLSCTRGEHHADLVFPEFPLSAGEYVVGAGISIPLSKWLHKDDCVGKLRVKAQDVYGSGRPPRAERYVLAVRHHWSIPENDAGLVEITK